jgi:hypothetical protein
MDNIDFPLLSAEKTSSESVVVLKYTDVFPSPRDMYSMQYTNPNVGQ